MEKRTMQACQNILDCVMQDRGGEQNRLLNMDIWDWSQGVALYGVWKYYELTGKKECLDWLTGWFDRQLQMAHEETINTMAPYLTLLYLYEETGSSAYLGALRNAADWLCSSLPRTEMSGFQHVTMDSQNDQQLWADTVFMAVLFLARIGYVCQKRGWQQEAQRQFILHIAYLSDLKNGLWYHGWSFLRKDHFAGAHWARGNCWFTIAAAECLDFLPRDSWVRQWIHEAYRQQAGTLMKLQDAGGLWHTLLDCEDSYIEVSGSCGILYGLLKGVRKGYLPAEYAENLEKGVQEAVSHIGRDGVVGQVSYGTIVADSQEYYKQVPLRPTGYGQNLMLMLLTEQLRWDAGR